MKKFTLKEYMKNPNIPVVTEDNKPVRIICTDRIGDYPVLALVSRTYIYGEKSEDIGEYNKYGESVHGYGQLFFKPPVDKTKWVCIFLGEDPETPMVITTDNEHDFEIYKTRYDFMGYVEYNYKGFEYKG